MEIAFTSSKMKQLSKMKQISFCRVTFGAILFIFRSTSRWHHQQRSPAGSANFNRTHPHRCPAPKVDSFRLQSRAPRRTSRNLKATNTTGRTFLRPTTKITPMSTFWWRERPVCGANLALRNEKSFSAWSLARWRRFKVSSRRILD